MGPQISGGGVGYVGAQGLRHYKTLPMSHDYETTPELAASGG